MLLRHVGWMTILLILVVTATVVHAQSPYDDVLVAQGLRNLQVENFDEALVNFKTAWEKGSKTSDKAYYLGIVNYRLTNYDEALKFMERALYLDPANNEIRLQLVAIFLALDRHVEALPHLQELEAANYKPTITAMYLGQVTARQNRTDQAVRYFNQAAENPQLAQQAKIQSSMALSKEAKYADAHRALQEAISFNPGSREAGFAQRYSDAISRRLEEIRPFQARLGASFDYDSNVTLTPSSIGAANLQQTGGRDAVFTQFGNFEYEFFPTGSYGLMTSYNLYMTWHPRLTTYDVMSHTFGVTPAYRSDNATLWLPFRFNYTDLDSNKYWSSFSLIPTYLYMATPNIGLETTLRLVRNYYWWLQPFPQEDRSSNNIGGSIGAYYFFKNQQGFIQARATYEHYGASGSNWTSSIYSLFLSVLYPVTEKLRLNPSLEIVVQPFEHRWFDGVEYQAKRRDKIMVFGFQVLYKLHRKLDANLHYYFIRDNSNIPLYDYNRTIAGLMLEYRY